MNSGSVVEISGVCHWFSPAVLTAGGEQGCCDVKRTLSLASDGVLLDVRLTVKVLGEL
jgi:hypothetical protein